MIKEFLNRRIRKLFVLSQERTCYVNKAEKQKRGISMESIWKQQIALPQRNILQEDIHIKNVVIGAGMAGILTAYLLQEQGQEVVVLEANTVASGQTGHTTAKITSQHNLIYAYLIEKFGEEKALQYGRANEKAIQEYERIIQKEKIACHFRRCSAYLYTEQEEKTAELENEMQAARLCGIEADFTKETELPFPVAGAVRFHNQAQFHPLEFVKKISEKLTIYEHSRVVRLEDHCVYTEQGMVEAEHVIFACHYPWILTPGYYFLRMHQERSYVLALETEKSMGDMYLGVDTEGCSFRGIEENGKHMLLLGGGSHRTGENIEGGKYEMLRKRAKLWYPGSKEQEHWSAQDCMPLDKIPYIGYFSSDIPNWYVATGFGKWGMSSSMVAAEIIRDMILGLENENEEVFAPQRFPVTAMSGNLAENTAKAVKGLSKQLFTTEGVPSKCSHMGCRLEKNADEGTWECPCHGSGFTAEGKLLRGPAQEDLAMHHA